MLANAVTLTGLICLFMDEFPPDYLHLHVFLWLIYWPVGNCWAERT